jgi:hypothetical protein
VALVVARFGGYVTSWGNFWGNHGGSVFDVLGPAPVEERLKD